MSIQKKQIKITIDPKGDVQIEALGYSDGSCRSATKPFEDAFGTVSDRQMKNPTELRTEREKVTS